MSSFFESSSGSGVGGPVAKWCNRVCWRFYGRERRLRLFVGRRRVEETTSVLNRYEEIHQRLKTVLPLTPPIGFTDYFEPTHEDALDAGAFGTVFQARATNKGWRALRNFVCDQVCAIRRIQNSDKDVEDIGRSLLLVSIDRHTDFFRAIVSNKCADNHLVRSFAQIIEAPHNLFFIMETCEGPDMEQWMRSRSAFLTEHHAATLMRQILQALHYLHRVAGVLHRDLKPEFFGFTQPIYKVTGPLPGIKLLDYGYFWLLPEPIVEDTAPRLLLPLRVCGTLHWVAPESWEGRSGPASDVWSVGLIAYYLLLRGLPFHLSLSFDPPSASKALQSNKLIFHGELVTSAARRFIGALLEKDSFRRATTTIALADSWLNTKYDPEKEAMASF